MDRTIALSLQDVGVRRGESWLVRHIDWTVPSGTCVALLGPNGSGKSTLARVLACHLWPSEGTVSVLGRKIGEADLHAVRQSIRLVKAAGPYDADPELTALEVVLTGCFGTIGLYDPCTDLMIADAERLLSQVGLVEVAHHRYATLSSGERVPALIARALIVRPTLLLLDEPTAGLDLLAREQVLGVIHRLFDQETGVGSSATADLRQESVAAPTVLLITHHVEELPSITHEVLLLSQGRTVAVGSPDCVLKSNILSDAYGCPLEIRQSNGRYYVEVHPKAWEGLFR